jgi:putative Holliday junction resolvase
MTAGAPARRGVVLAVDLGSRRIGLAVTDRARTMAFPRPALLRRGDAAVDHQAIREVVEDAGAQTVVVGLPLSLDGTRGPAARGAAEEAEALGAALDGTGAVVELFDERLTTVSAATSLAAAGKGSKAARASVDSAAATVLLEAWLATDRSGPRVAL